MYGQRDENRVPAPLPVQRAKPAACHSPPECLPASCLCAASNCGQQAAEAAGSRAESGAIRRAAMGLALGPKPCSGLLGRRGCPPAQAVVPAAPRAAGRGHERHRHLGMLLRLLRGLKGGIVGTAGGCRRDGEGCGLGVVAIRRVASGSCLGLGLPGLAGSDLHLAITQPGGTWCSGSAAVDADDGGACRGVGVGVALVPRVVVLAERALGRQGDTSGAAAILSGLQRGSQCGYRVTGSLLQ